LCVLETGPHEFGPLFVRWRSVLALPTKATEAAKQGANKSQIARNQRDLARIRSVQEIFGILELGAPCLIEIRA